LLGLLDCLLDCLVDTSLGEQAEMNAQIDGLGIEELCDRYGIKKAQLYNRKNSLSLEFEIPSGGRKSIANA